MPGARVAKIGSSRSTTGFFAADHHAIAALDAPDAAAGADIDIVRGPCSFSALRAADIVLPKGVAAVDDDVVRLQQSASVSMVASVIWPAGSITQTVRGFSNLLTKSSGELGADCALRPQALRPLRDRCVIDDAVCSCCIRRRTMLPPIRPRPIMPSCILISLVQCFRYRGIQCGQTPAPDRL